ncbi:MAG TPA: group 1 truncated hemoglobin, partial [Gemmatales bacterium]|nr:group 1 truncated hemoglobin [Gemmatales bacterium]
ITLVLDDFLTRTLKNPKVNFSRKDQGQEWAGNPDQISNLKKQLLAMISQATGGPYNYTGKSMEDAHKGMKIREAEFEAMLEDLKSSMDQLKINAAERDELLALIAKTKLQIIEK